MEDRTMPSGDPGLPRSLTDADFQAFSLEVAHALAQNQGLIEPRGLAGQAESAGKAATYLAQLRSGGESAELQGGNAGGNAWTAALEELAPVHCDLSIAELVEHALLQAEGILSDRGALCVKTLPYGGTTAGSYYAVDSALSLDEALALAQAIPQTISWATPQPWVAPSQQLRPMDAGTFEALYQRALGYGEDRALYRCEGRILAQADGLPLQIICELASQAIMVRHWLMPLPEEAVNAVPSTDPGPEPLSAAGEVAGETAEGQAVSQEAQEGLTVISLPGLKGEPWLESLLDTEVVIAIHPARRLALVLGSRHGGDLRGAIAALIAELTSDALTWRDGALALLDAGTAAVFLGAPGSGKQALASASAQALGHRDWWLGPLLWRSCDREIPTAGGAAIAGGAAVLSGSKIASKITSKITSGGTGLQLPLAGGYGNVTGLAPADALHQQLGFGALLENVPLQETSSQPKFGALFPAIPFRAAWGDARGQAALAGRDSMADVLDPAHQPGQTLVHTSAQAQGPAAVLPRAIFLLVADMVGVLPAIARLTPEQAVYYFALGYGARLPGWTRDQTQPMAQFAALDPQRAVRDSLRFRDRLNAQTSNAQTSQLQTRPAVYLLNTGWLGPIPPEGRSLLQRIPLSVSQALVQAALNGEIPDGSSAGCFMGSSTGGLGESPADNGLSSQPVPICRDPLFGWALPMGQAQLPSRWCQPWNAWGNARHWQTAAIALARQFEAPMAALVAAGLPPEIAQAGPSI